MSTYLAIQTTIDYGKIFPPDELAQGQYYQTARRTHYASAELRLMAAVLEDAVATLLTDLRRCSSRQRRDYAEALKWINRRDDGDSAFSFINICESLALDPDYLRQGLNRKCAEIRDLKPLSGTGVRKYPSPRRKSVRLRLG